MQARRPLAVLAATAVAALGLTALTTPVHASTNVTIGGTKTEATVTPPAWIGTTVTVTVAPGLTFGSTVTLYSPSLRDSSGNLCTAKSPITGLCVLNPTGTNTATFDILVGADEAVVELFDQEGEKISASFLVSNPGGSDSSGHSRSESTPSPHIQQFEKPATGTCDEAQPEGLNWGGAVSGGWGGSWAQWANEGRGGPVCTRTLAYNTSTETWQVQ